MAVQASGGEPRVLGTCDPDNRPTFDWTPDGNGLVFSSPMSGDGEPGLRLLDLATGRWRAIDYGASAEDVDTAPRFSPDGKWIAFVRNTPLGDLWRIPSSGGEAERLTHQRAELRGWDWTPDGKAIVFGRRVDSHTRLYRLTLSDGDITDLGIEDAQAPAIAAQSNVLAFVQRKPQFGLYRIGEALQATAKRAPAAPVPVHGTRFAAVGGAGWQADRVHLRPLGRIRVVVGRHGAAGVAAPDRRHPS